MDKRNIKSRCKFKIISSLLVVVLGLVSVMSINSSAEAMTVQYHGPAEIMQYALERGVSNHYPVNYTIQPDVGIQGSVAPDTLNSALTFTNFIRHVAGLNEASLDDSYNYYAQLAAYVCAINGQTYHGLYDDRLGDLAEDACLGTLSSNLFHSPVDLNTSVLVYMSDSDSTNISRLGHRRWVLYPDLKKVGFGISPSLDGNNYHAMRVFNNADNGQDSGMNYGKPSAYGVAWPAMNTPIEFLNANYPWNDAWSIAFGTQLDASKVTVNLRNVNTGQIWNFGPNGSNGEFYVSNENYGQAGCVIFRPDVRLEYHNGDVYEVTVNGIDSSLYPETSLTYRVNFFSVFSVHPSTAPDIGAEGDMYRMYNVYSGEHFYTGSITERDNLVISGWYYENIEWNAPTSDGDPVYRLYNPYSGDHHYTLYTVERDALVNVGWIYEGEAWKSNNSGNGTPVYRLFNPNAQTASHHYTTNVGERDYLILNGWLDEGIGWYGN